MLAVIGGSGCGGRTVDVDAGAPPRDAGLDATSPPDAGTPDAGAPDAGVDACTPESRSARCRAAGLTCGEHDLRDRCGDVQTTNCGACRAPATCEAGVCVAPPPRSECVAAIVAECRTSLCALPFYDLNDCMADCGVFVDPACVASRCNREVTAYADCMFDCPGLSECGTPCQNLCARLIDEDCGEVTTLVGCELDCEALWAVEFGPVPTGCGTAISCRHVSACSALPNTRCDPGEHRCSADLCLPSADVCDGTADCADASDELGESCGSPRCSTGERLCGGACASCPTAGVESAQCDGTACVVDRCAPGHRPCSTGCCPMAFAPVPGAVPSGRVLGPLAVAVGGSGTLHVVFGIVREGLSHAQLRYAERSAAGTWAVSTIETAPGASDSYTHLAIALGSDGLPHVASGGTVGSAGGVAVTYRRKSGSAWTTPELAVPIASRDLTERVVRLSLALTASNAPAVLVERNGAGVVYGWRDATGAWTHEAVHPNAGSSELRMLADDTPSFVRPVGGATLYQRIGGVWSSTYYGRGSSLSVGSSFALQAPDRGLMAYYTAAHSLMLSPFMDPTLPNETIDSPTLMTTTSTPGRVVLEVSMAGEPVVAYTADEGVLVATRAGNRWATGRVASGARDTTMAMDLDASGLPWLCIQSEMALHCTR